MYDKKMEEAARVVMSEHPHKRVGSLTLAIKEKRCEASKNGLFFCQFFHLFLE